jgi:hypothetical protein
MIVGLAGYARSGKDTAAKEFIDRGFIRVAFADLLKEFVYIVNPYIVDEGAFGVVHRLQEIVDAGGWEAGKHYPEVRRLLQVTGTEAARGLLGQSIWIDAVFNNLRKGDDYVISDVRTRAEVNRIHDEGGLVVWIHREGVGPANDHVSESELSQYDCDRVVSNPGSPEEYRVIVGDLLDQIWKGSRGKHS